MTPTINRFGSAIARTRLILIATALLATFPAAGQDAPLSAIAVDDAVDAEQIESAIRAVEAREGLDVETRNKIVEQLRDAQALISRKQVAEAALEPEILFDRTQFREIRVRNHTVDGFFERPESAFHR